MPKMVPEHIACDRCASPIRRLACSYEAVLRDDGVYVHVLFFSCINICGAIFYVNIERPREFMGAEFKFKDIRYYQGKLSAEEIVKKLSSWRGGFKDGDF